MARPGSAVALWGQYLAARAADMAVNVLPSAGAASAAATLGRLVYHLDPRHRRRAIDHLAIAFPALGPARRQRLAAASFEHFLRLILEMCQAPRRLHPHNWHDHVALSNLGPAAEWLNTGRPAILVTGHIGNWEILGYFLAILGYPVTAIARPIDNPLVDDWIVRVRQRRGLRILSKQDATRRMPQILAAGGALGFIADQNAGDKGLFVPFFGRLASAHKSIGLLAIDQNVPIICGCALRERGDLRFTMRVTQIIHPRDWADRRDPLFYVTARFTHALEEMVRHCPEQYLWMHRRWKSRPPHERKARPMPDTLRRNLEELDWLSAAQLRAMTGQEGEARPGEGF